MSLQLPGDPVTGITNPLPGDADAADWGPELEVLTPPTAGGPRSARSLLSCDHPWPLQGRPAPQPPPTPASPYKSLWCSCFLLLEFTPLEPPYLKTHLLFGLFSLGHKLV